MKLAGGMMTGIVGRILTNLINKKLETEAKLSISNLSVVTDDTGLMKIHIDADAELPAAAVNKFIKDKI